MESGQSNRALAETWCIAPTEFPTSASANIETNVLNIICAHQHLCFWARPLRNVLIMRRSRRVMRYHHQAYSEIPSISQEHKLILNFRLYHAWCEKRRSQWNEESIFHTHVWAVTHLNAKEASFALAYIIHTDAPNPGHALLRSGCVL